jgi:hypothetical protein
MMDQRQLFLELDRLQALLASRPLSGPLPSLRERVLGDVRGELRRQRRSQRRQFATAFAATIVLGAGLSLAVWQGARHAFQRRSSLPSVSQVAEQIRARAPELSREESVRQAVLVTLSYQVGGQARQDVPSYARFVVQPVEPVAASAGAPVPSMTTKCSATPSQPPIVNPIIP